MNATLFIDHWASKCGECGKGADPYEKKHKTALPGFNRQGTHGKGCGVRWTHVSSNYIGMDERIAEMRPDLILIPVSAQFERRDH